MIQKINFKLNNKDFIYTYSDKFVYIKREGIEYVDAIDPVGFDREYAETNTPLPIEVIASIKEQIEMISNEE